MLSLAFWMACWNDIKNINYHYSDVHHSLSLHRWQLEVKNVLYFFSSSPFHCAGADPNQFPPFYGNRSNFPNEWKSKIFCGGTWIRCSVKFFSWIQACCASISLCFFYWKILQCCKMLSYFSRLPPSCDSYFTPIKTLPSSIIFMVTCMHLV